MHNQTRQKTRAVFDRIKEEREVEGLTLAPAISEEMRTGKDTSLTGKMLATAIKATRPTTLEWIEQAAHYASYGNTSGVYDELADYLRERK